MSGNWVSRGMLALVVGATVLGTPPAYADVSAADRAAARALFDQARKLVKEGKHAEACPKFEESQRLDPGLGTQFNLADCYEQVGRTATAWSMFLEVASEAKMSGQADREKVARKRAETLESKLSKISISVATKVPGLQVKRDGSVLGEPVWGTPIPVDPGDHVVEASAPNKKTWKSAVKVSSTATTTTVTVPGLEDEAAAVVAPLATSAAPSAAPPPPPATTPIAAEPPTSPPAESNAGGTQRTIGLVAGGVGLVGLAVAGFMTVGAKNKLKDADDHCEGNRCWDQTGVDLHKDAVSQANTATIVGAIGLVCLAGGATLYFTAPSGKGSTATGKRSTSIGLGPASLFVKGEW